MLSKSKGLPLEMHQEVWNKKQNITLNELLKLKEDKRLKKIINSFSKEKYKISVCSNSIRKTCLLFCQN